MTALTSSAPVSTLVDVAKEPTAATLAKLEQARAAQLRIESLEPPYRQALAERAKLIRFLSKQMTGRDIAQHIGISHQRVHAIAGKRDAR